MMPRFSSWKNLCLVDNNDMIVALASYLASSLPAMVYVQVDTSTCVHASPQLQTLPDLQFLLIPQERAGVSGLFCMMRQGVTSWLTEKPKEEPERSHSSKYAQALLTVLKGKGKNLDRNEWEGGRAMKQWLAVYDDGKFLQESPMGLEILKV